MPQPLPPIVAPRRPFSLAAFFAGILFPFGYTLAALFVLFFTGRRSPIEAFYSLDVPVVIALAAFPPIVWLIRRKIPQRGFLPGILAGLLVLPTLALLALAISFRRGI